MEIIVGKTLRETVFMKLFDIIFESSVEDIYRRKEDERRIMRDSKILPDHVYKEIVDIKLYCLEFVVDEKINEIKLKREKYMDRYDDETYNYIRKLFN
jgi:hypothetical protein